MPWKSKTYEIWNIQAHVYPFVCPAYGLTCLEDGGKHFKRIFTLMVFVVVLFQKPLQRLLQVLIIQ